MSQYYLKTHIGSVKNFMLTFFFSFLNVEHRKSNLTGRQDHWYTVASLLISVPQPTVPRTQHAAPLPQLLHMSLPPGPSSPSSGRSQAILPPGRPPGPWAHQANDGCLHAELSNEPPTKYISSSALFLFLFILPIDLHIQTVATSMCDSLYLN